MPSSLIFAALAVAWLVVLVPIVAKRRQEVVRTADSALAARVLRRRAAGNRDEEVCAMTDRTAPPQRAPGGDVPAAAYPGTRFRPGRGGYDVEAAALAARAKYAFRQRVVVTLLLGAVGTVLLGVFSSTAFWWVHAGLDVSLLGYLAYLRRQVRIEEEVRRRRAARVAGAQRCPSPQAGPVTPAEPAEPAQPAEPDGWDERGEWDEGNDRDEPGDAEQAEYEPPLPAARPAPPQLPVYRGAVAVDLDDEDPAFDELDPSFEPPYRRAAGE